MEPTIIRTNTQYIEALKRLILIMDAASGTPESKERELLLVLLTKYERKYAISTEMELMPK